MALHHWSGGSAEGLALFDAWSRTHPDRYDERAPGKKWASLGRSGKGPTTTATVFKWAMDNGWARSQRSTRDYSDTLLVFRLKALRLEMYREQRGNAEKDPRELAGELARFFRETEGLGDGDGSWRR